MSALGYAVTRPLLEVAVDAALGLARLPAPMDAPFVHAPGPDPDRLLLVGTAAAAGVGVATHQLAIGGQLARCLSSATGRGVDLEIDAAITLTLPEAGERIAERQLASFDAIILLVGAREAIGMQPMRLWKSRLREVLTDIRAREGAPQVFVIGTPPVHRYASLPGHLGERIEGNLLTQNRVTASVCAQIPETTFVPLEVEQGDHYQLNSQAYESWARQLAPAIAVGLNRGSCRERRAMPVDEGARQAALDALRVVGTDADARFDRVARTARDLLGASGASVTFLDHDRQWIKSAVSMSSADTSRAASFCNTTISRAELFVVEDAADDPAFVGHPWVAGSERVRFYAGYPVEAPTGERIGALCIVDTKPRRFSSAEAALLRELALRVQDLLWAG